MRLYTKEEQIDISGDTIIGEGDFLECVNALSQGLCSAIYGPGGGKLVLDNQDCLVIRVDGSRPYFSTNNYLGTWRILK